MFLKITLITSLVTVCSCATPTYPEAKKSNRAVYSQSFNREDVPISYTYSAVHVYTPKQKQEPAQKILKNVNTAEVQYAPLPVQNDEQPWQNEAGLYTKAEYTKDFSETDVSEHSTESTAKTNHLEPKESNKPVLKSPTIHNKFIPGHNIQVLQLSDHNPSTYNYHRISPQTERQTMGHYLEQFAFYEEPQRPSLAVTTFRPTAAEYTGSTETPMVPSYTFVPKAQGIQQVNLYKKDGKIPQVDHAGHLQPAKVPQLQLNIGREYKLHHQHQNRMAPAHISQARFYTYPLNQQIFVNPQAKKTPSDMSQLQPLPNHLHLSAYSRT